MSVQRVNPDALAPPVQGLYSHAVTGTGTRFVAIAGQIALDAEGNLVGPGDHDRLHCLCLGCNGRSVASCCAQAAVLLREPDANPLTRELIARERLFR